MLYFIANFNRKTSLKEFLIYYNETFKIVLEL